jgi:hypothetical protein
MYCTRCYRDSVKYMVWDAAGGMKMTDTRWIWIQYCLLGQTWYFKLWVLELFISFIFLYVSTFLLLLRVSASTSCLFSPPFLYISVRFFNAALFTVRHCHHHCSSDFSELRIILNGFRLMSVTVSGPRHRAPPLRVKYSWYFFLLEADLNPGPQCGRKDYVSEKFEWLRRDIYGIIYYPKFRVHT